VLQAEKETKKPKKNDKIDIKSIKITDFLIKFPAETLKILVIGSDVKVPEDYDIFHKINEYNKVGAGLQKFLNKKKRRLTLQ
jgi:hypothetical protein